jgi:hypothetical protein
MNENIKQVYQFKISLLDIAPPIWRRVQVPDYYTFSELHNVIQKAMGWDNSHLYEFSKTRGNPIPEDGKIKDVFSLENNKAYYEYDLGDSWVHEILLEKILPAVRDSRYPVCIDGKRACPPEDCGGVPGYINLLRVINNPKHPQYRSMKEWLVDEFDSEEFNPENVDFGDE